ncbi:DUF3967 domain-containing protein [Priestia aryabhattai]|uniref:DUF3967 domain-containing protein n=1 Tax=Priestia aryabhattai TaxID=412384 RepID=UPI003D287FCC
MSEEDITIIEMEDILKTKEIADMTGLAQSTVRKYAQELEKAGYVFKKDETGRFYTKEDVVIFTQLKEVRDKAGIKVEHAADVVVTQYKRTIQNMSPAEASVKQENEAIQIQHTMQYIEKLEEAIQQQQNMISKLEERLERQEKRQDLRDESLTQVLREVAETKKMLAASKEKKWYEFWK